MTFWPTHNQGQWLHSLWVC